MKNWQSLVTLLIGIILVIALWPILKWAVLVLLLLIIFAAVRFWYLAKETRKQLEEAAKQMEEESEIYESRYRGGASDDVIDVEYTERRVEDDDR